jgi:hypothetical protein
MYSIGLDLGQRRDPAAIAVVGKLDSRPLEVRRLYGSTERSGFTVRHLERIPLGTPYPLVVERVRKIGEHWELAGRCNLVVDATGVGGPVVDLLRGAGLGFEVCAVTITGGGQEHKLNNGGFSVPKQDLFAGLQVLLEKNELHIAKQLKEAVALRRELLSVKQRESDTGRVKMGAEGTGQHDDLVMALALACWRAKRKEIGWGSGRLLGV